MAIISFCSWSRFCEYPMFWITWKLYSDTTNHRAQGREPLHYIILMKANVYVKIPLSALNIDSVTVSHVYSVRLLSAIVLNTNSGKATSVVWGVPALWSRAWGHGHRGEELGRVLMLGCIIGLFIPHLTAGMNHSASPLLKVIQKECFKSWICDCSLLAIFRYFYCLGRKFY